MTKSPVLIFIQYHFSCHVIGFYCLFPIGFNGFVETEATWTDPCRLETWKYYVGRSSQTTIPVCLKFYYIHKIKMKTVKNAIC